MNDFYILQTLGGYEEASSGATMSKFGLLMILINIALKLVITFGMIRIAMELRKKNPGYEAEAGGEEEENDGYDFNDKNDRIVPGRQKIDPERNEYRDEYGSENQ